jgi:hypothetical protein
MLDLHSIQPYFQAAAFIFWHHRPLPLLLSHQPAARKYQAMSHPPCTEPDLVFSLLKTRRTMLGVHRHWSRPWIYCYNLTIKEKWKNSEGKPASRIGTPCVERGREPSFICTQNYYRSTCERGNYKAWITFNAELTEDDTINNFTH